MNPKRDWDEFWFSTIYSGPLGLFRIVYGFIVMFFAILLFPDRFLWFSERGVLTSASVNVYSQTGTPGPRWFDFLHVSDPLLTLFFVLFIIAAFFLMVGLWSRPAALLIWIGLNAIHNRNPVIMNSGDLIMLVMAAYLFLSPAGASCSIDRLRRVWRGKDGEAAPRIVPWAQRLMQLQVCIVYLCTSLGKTGSDWQNGTAVYYALHLPELARFPIPFTDGSSLFMIHALTYGTIAVEFALATLIWVPRLRLAVILAGTLLHLGIEYSMNIPLFSFLMIGSYILFLKEEDWVKLNNFLRGPLSEAKLRLVYDGECDFCRSALLVVRFFDVFRLIEFLDYHKPEELEQAPGVSFDEAEEAAIAVDKRGRKYVGFYAFQKMIWRLPGLFILGPLLYLPAVPVLGKRAYRWVAANRSRLPVAPRFLSKAQLRREKALSR